MEVKLQPTEYGNLVQQVGDLDLYKVSFGLGVSHYYTTKEEARQQILAWNQQMLRTYKRACLGRTEAQQALKILMKTQPKLIPAEDSL